MACGNAVVPSPPVNTALPTVSGVMRPGAVLTANAGAWLNSPTTFLIQWQRAVGGDWATIPGAIGILLRAHRRGRRRHPACDGHGHQRRRRGDRRLAASGPIAGYPAPLPGAQVTPKAPATPQRVRLSIALRDHARHAKGTLAARVVAVPAGREVRTDAVKVRVTPGTWRLRLCAGPKKGPLRCALSKRVRTRAHSVRLPATKVLVHSPSGALKVTAALVDKRQRVRAQGSAASA